MNAILYAAGPATRLGESARHLPKILLEFGGRSLLERHAMLLADRRVPKLFVVTGHLREQIRAVLPALQSRYGIELEEMYNPHFTEGSALSFYTSLSAMESVRDGVLVMDGDVLYDGRILDRLFESPHRTALLVDRGYSTADDDPVLVPMRQGRPFEFVKRWRGEADSVGESVGFFKIGAPDLPRLVAETRARANGPGRAESYDEILRVLVKDGCFAAVDITGLPWSEIDFPADVEYANRLILPALDSGVRLPDPAT